MGGHTRSKENNYYSVSTPATWAEGHNDIFLASIQATIECCLGNSWMIALWSPCTSSCHLASVTYAMSRKQCKDIYENGENTMMLVYSGWRKTVSITQQNKLQLKGWLVLFKSKSGMSPWNMAESQTTYTWKAWKNLLHCSAAQAFYQSTQSIVGCSELIET